MTVSIHVLRALQRKRDHSFKDFWAIIEGKRSFAATADVVSSKFTLIDRETHQLK